jgi:hypothetical protein
MPNRKRKMAPAVLESSKTASSEAADLSKLQPIPGCDTRTGSKPLATFGHWEVWEMEWGGARWVWDQAFMFDTAGSEAPDRRKALTSRA